MTYYILGPRIQTRIASGLFTRARNVEITKRTLKKLLSEARGEIKLFNSFEQAKAYAVATAEFQANTAVTSNWGIEVSPIYEVELEDDDELAKRKECQVEAISILASSTGDSLIPTHVYKVISKSEIKAIITGTITHPIPVIKGLEQAVDDKHIGLSDINDVKKGCAIL